MAAGAVVQLMAADHVRQMLLNLGKPPSFVDDVETSDAQPVANPPAPEEAAAPEEAEGVASKPAEQVRPYTLVVLLPGC